MRVFISHSSKDKPAVEALASALIEQGKLGGDAAAAVIGGVQRAHRRRSGFASFFRNVR